MRFSRFQSYLFLAAIQSMRRNPLKIGYAYSMAEILMIGLLKSIIMKPEKILVTLSAWKMV
jgi:hypothetical protein